MTHEILNLKATSGGRELFSPISRPEKRPLCVTVQADLLRRFKDALPSEPRDGERKNVGGFYDLKICSPPAHERASPLGNYGSHYRARYRRAFPFTTFNGERKQGDRFRYLLLSRDPSPVFSRGPVDVTRMSSTLDLSRSKCWRDTREEASLTQRTRGWTPPRTPRGTGGLNGKACTHALSAALPMLNHPTIPATTHSVAQPR